jgi:hypothetical protein
MEVDAALGGRYSEPIYGKRLVLIANPATPNHPAPNAAFGLPLRFRSYTFFSNTQTFGSSPLAVPGHSATHLSVVGGYFTA